MNFASIKNQKSNIATMQQKVQQQGKKPADPRKFKHTYDKDTFHGSTLIRFLPRYDADGGIAVPWAHWVEYNFGGDGTTPKYWHRSLTNIGQVDPVATLNNAHWKLIGNDKQGAEAAIARERSQKKRYVANIAVLDDPSNPENNGKVFLYEFGPAVQNILEKNWFPTHADKKPLEFFDWDVGASFRIRTCKDSKGWFNYDDSEFEPISALAGGDSAKQEAIYNMMYDLSEFEAEDKYETYEVLEANMIKSVGARNIARITGEEFSPEKAAGVNQNPFSDGSTTDNSQVDNTNKVVEQAVEKVDPFANMTKTEGAGDADPFANAKSSNDAADPFANLKAS